MPPHKICIVHNDYTIDQINDRVQRSKAFRQHSIFYAGNQLSLDFNKYPLPFFTPRLNPLFTQFRTDEAILQPSPQQLAHVDFPLLKDFIYYTQIGEIKFTSRQIHQYNENHLV